MRPPKSLKRVLESRNAEMTENDTEFKASEPTSTKNKRRQKDVFKLVLPPDLVKDLENSSDEIFNIHRPTRSTKSNSSIRQPTIEILSSSDEEDLAGSYHPLPGRSSVEDKGKSLPEENSSLVNKGKSLPEENSSLVNKGKPLPEENSSLVNKGKSLPEKNSSLVNKRMSPVLNSSTPKRHKSNLLYPMKQKSIQSLKKRIELDSEDSDNDPFGFEKAEKRVRERNIKSQFSSDNSGKFEVTTIDKDNQYNDNVQSEITKRISLDKETNKNDTNGSSAFSEIDKQDRIQSKQENKESNTLSENEKDDDNYQIDSSKSQSTHDEGHLSTENTENNKGSAESSGLSPIKTPRDRNKKAEKKNTTPSKVKKTLLKTSDLIPLLPLRRRQERASKKKANKYNDYLFDDDDEVFLDEKKEESDYEEKTLPKKRKVRKMQSEKSEKKHRKIVLSLESEDEQTKTKQERAERIRHAEEIDNFELAEEVID